MKKRTLAVTEILLKLAETHEKEEVFQLVIEYLTSTIEGSGCSIFLVNPSTNELNMVASSHIPEAERDKCKYQKGEGFTGWPFKFKKLLYIPDENDHEYIKQIKPEPPVHIGDKGGKPCETSPIGPFMAAPILSKGYVIGVIRLPTVKGKKKEYSKEEQNLFQTFAAKLAESIESANLIEKQNNLIHTYAKIGKANDIMQLLSEIIYDIPAIVGGGGFSVFLFEGERTEEGKKKFVLKKTTSVKKDFVALTDKVNKYCYIEGGDGLTSWVATNGQSIRLNDINDEKELRTKSRGYQAPVHVKGPCEIDDVGPFLASPLKEEDEVIGVVRIPRRSGSKPFEEIDEELLNAFADELSLTMGAINRKKMLDEIRKKRTNEFESLFSIRLINECKNLSKLDYADEIREFLRFPDKDETIDAEIMNSLEAMWCEKYREKYNFSIFKDFSAYEKLLLELPGYRDHFIHQYQVFLLGAVIIDKLYKLSDEKGTKTFSDFYHEALNIKRKDNVVTDSAWLITSTFHDIAYPIQRSNELFNKFFEKLMGFNEEIVEKISLEKVIADRRYGKLIDQLCDFHFSMQSKKSQWKFDPSSVSKICVDDNFRTALKYCLLALRDHGVLGSLVLPHQSEAGKKEYSTIIYPSALAIALHKELLFIMNDDIRFEKNPLAFLLKYCDFIQEWGRGKEEGQEISELKEIKVNYVKDSKIHVRTKIRLENRELIDEKSAEAKSVFDKLKSNEVIFEFVIENTGEPFFSGSY